MLLTLLDISAALEYLHNVLSIVHGDLKVRFRPCAIRSLYTSGQWLWPAWRRLNPLNPPRTALCVTVFKPPSPVCPQARNVLLKSERKDRRGFVAKIGDFGLSRWVLCRGA